MSWGRKISPKVRNEKGRIRKVKNKEGKDVNHKYCLLFDLDHTLIHTCTNTDQLNCDQSYSILNNQLQLWLRPNCGKLLQDCLQHFRVGIWTAAEEQYAREVLAKILPKESDRKKLVLFLARKGNNLHRFYDLKSGQYLAADLKYHTMGKSMNKLFQHSYFNQILHPDKTVLLDDLESNYRLNPYNLILVKPYHYFSPDQYLFSIWNKLHQYPSKFPKDIRRLLISPSNNNASHEESSIKSK